MFEQLIYEKDYAYSISEVDNVFQIIRYTYNGECLLFDEVQYISDKELMNQINNLLS